ncbi:PQQ-dependent sugar dehydrogenase [Dermacoccaceae bacterium W4C1]
MVVTASVVAAPQAAAEELAPGVSTTTIWDGSTALYNARGERAPGLQGRAATPGAQGVGEVEFGRYGDAIVAEKSGRISYFSSTGTRSGSLLTDTAGKDLTADTLVTGDTGLGGVALDPAWPLRPYVYALYTSNDKKPAQGTGKWANDECPPDGSCIVDGKLERLTIGTRYAGGRLVRYISARKVLIDRGWCQGAWTHSVGDVTFGPDGALYASAGDGTRPDGGLPVQQQLCSDQVSTKYPSQMAPLDALDDSVPTSLNGKIIRVDPATGRGISGNPWANSSDENRRRIISIGFRNPYRMAFKPNSNTIGISMVGQNTRETVYEIPARPAGNPTNAGWPCWEGTALQALGPLCTGLAPSLGNVLTPKVEWEHRQPLVPGEPCPAGGSESSMGVTYTQWWWPSKYRNAMLFNDFGRGCLWYQDSGGENHWLGTFDRHTVRSLTRDQLGRIYFADFQNGSVRRLNL